MFFDWTDWHQSLFQHKVNLFSLSLTCRQLQPLHPETVLLHLLPSVTQKLDGPHTRPPLQKGQRGSLFVPKREMDGQRISVWDHFCVFLVYFNRVTMRHFEEEMHPNNNSKTKQATAYWRQRQIFLSVLNDDSNLRWKSSAFLPTWQFKSNQ